jgi:hypothetical protein
VKKLNTSNNVLQHNIQETQHESDSDVANDSFVKPQDPPKLGAVCDELKYANFDAKQLDKVMKYFNKLK